ncbi:MAG: hypothetical protein ABSB00_00435 [Minisyncoccia bacterium]|jgi:hypothetical protein
MTIAKTREKCKTVIVRIPRDALVIAVPVLASLASFGLGYLAGLDVGVPAQTGQESEVKIEESSAISTTTAIRQVVASKNGTKYYSLLCAGAVRISDTNYK